MRRFVLALVLVALSVTLVTPAAAHHRPGDPAPNPWERRSKVLTDQQQVDQWAENLARGWKAVVQNSMNKVVAAKYLKGALPALCGVAAASAALPPTDIDGNPTPGYHPKYAHVYAKLQQTVAAYGFPVVC